MFASTSKSIINKLLDDQQVTWPGDLHAIQEPISEAARTETGDDTQALGDKPMGVRLQRKMAEVRNLQIWAYRTDFFDQIPIWSSIEPDITQALPSQELQLKNEDVKPVMDSKIPFDSRTDLVSEHNKGYNMSQQQPDVRELLKQSVGRYNSSVLYDNAFPTSTGRSKAAKDAILHLLKMFQPEDFAAEMRRRIQVDHLYLNRLSGMVITTCLFLFLMLTSSS